MRRLLILLTFAFCLSSESGHAVNVTRLAHWAEGPSVTVAAAGNIVLLGHGGFLEALAFGDPAHPVSLGRIELEGFITDIHMTESLAFVYVESRGIHVLDVVDPGEIRPRAFLAVEDYLRGMQTVGTTLYYATAQSGFHIVDVSDPMFPVELGVLGEVNLITCSVVGDHAYISQTPGVLLIADVSDPAAPYVKSVLPPMPGYPQFNQLAHADGLLFGLMRNILGFHSFRTFDLVDPANPTLVGLLTSALDLRTFTVSGNRVRFLSPNEILIYDVSDPWSPAQLGTAPLLDIPHDLAASGDLAFVAESDFGLQCFTTSVGVRAAAPVVEVSRFGEGLHGAFTDVVLEGDLLYASAVAPGLIVFDATDLSQARIVGSLYDHVPGAPDTRGYSVTVHDGHAYLRCSDAAGSWLRVIDVTDPTAPVEVASLEGSLSNTQFRGAVGYSVRTDGGYRLMAHDFTDPATPQPLLDIPLSSWSALCVDGDLLLLITEDVLSVYRIDDPDQLTWLGETNLEWGSPQPPIVATSANGLAYVAASAMRVVDYSDPGAMVVHTTTAPVDQTWDIATDGEFLYLAEGPHGVEAYSLVDPRAPTPSAAYRTGYWAWSVSGTGARFFVADSHDGVYALRNDLAVSGVDELPDRVGVRIGSYPNPFNPRTTVRYSLSGPGWVRVTVHDARGRKVRTLVDGPRTEGSHTLGWDGRDEDGSLVPSGVYYLGIEANGDRARSKAVLVR